MQPNLQIIKTKIGNRLSTFFYWHKKLLFKLCVCGTPGIFLTADDFSAHKLTYVSDTTKLRLHQLIEKPFIEVYYNDTVIRKYKDSIYGYCDKFNTSYRFYNSHAYEILNNSDNILLYKRTEYATEKGHPVITTYFFSAKANSPPIILSKKNLCISFAENKIFCELIKTHFEDDSELISYDHTCKMYRINTLYEKSIQTTNTIKNEN
jgi:hypothetical protein